MSESSGSWIDNIISYLPWNRRNSRSIALNPWGRLNNPSSGGVIEVKRVDLCIKDNTKKHHTYRYETDPANLIVRRGFSFKLKIWFNRPFVKHKDDISFIFTVSDEPKPTHGHGTFVGIVPCNQPEQLGDPWQWGASIMSIEGDILTVLIKPSVTCPVTQWNMDIDTKLSNGNAKSYSLPGKIYTLYNAWCQHDQVFMSETANRDEYVLSDTTLVWRGSYNRLRPTVWKLGQFESNVLDCALLLVAKIGKVSAGYRGDSIRTCRALAAAVNSTDDNGAVLGNWTDDFSGGTAPTQWVGSVEIMQTFYKKQKPVKFGQCWTFSGVLSTAARALGIPSRIVTNYSSAHDTQASLTVDYFVNEKGDVMEEMNTDSIWNYHVWNEVWMNRPDLGIGSYGSYDGWQAVDATPQEKSDGMYRCGPASVLAVKLGEILRPYDSNFLYSEVNADKVFWRYTGPYQPMKLLRQDIFGIGQFISTKVVGKWEREDITSTYKFPEKTGDERNSMVKALQQTNSPFSRYYLNENFNDVYFDFELRDDIKIGETFNVVLSIKNRSFDHFHTVNGNLTVDTILYTGTNRQSVKSIAYEVDVEPDSTKYVKMEVTFQEYYPKLKDQAAFNISCFAQVKDTSYDYYAQDDFRVRKPDIKIYFQGNAISQVPVDVIVRLINPLPIPLTKGLFYIDGPGIEKSLKFKISEIPVGGTASSTFKYKPPYAGKHTLVAKFISKELDDVDGFLSHEVKPNLDDSSSNGNTYTDEVISRNDVIG